MAYVKALFQHLPVGAVENHVHHGSGVYLILIYGVWGVKGSPSVKVATYILIKGQLQIIFSMSVLISCPLHNFNM
jgi:hypothetical protein